MPHILTRAEVILILNLLERQGMLMLANDPPADLSEAQRAYGLLCAERSLRARELAAIDAEGKLRVDNAVLAPVANCVLAQRAYTATLITADKRADQMHIYQQTEHFVAQTCPTAGLYRFVPLPNADAARDELVRALLLDLDPPASNTPAFRASGDALKQARAAADAGDAPAARAALVAGGVPAASADAFAKFLASPHNFATLHTITAQVDGNAAMQAITVLSNAQAAWQMVEGADGAFTLAPVTRAMLASSLFA